MSYDLAAAFSLFALVAAITPGPNNIMLMTSGLNFGFRRTQAHLMGVAIGFAVMVLIIGFGLGAVFEAYPTIYTVLKYVGAAYLIYLAWRIAGAGPMKTETTRRRPFNFFEAAAFQWVNPKAWAIAVGAVTAYAAIASYPFNIFLMAAIFCVITIASCLVWVLFGTSLRSVLSHPKVVRAFNIAMALALVASLYPVLVDAGQ